MLSSSATALLLLQPELPPGTLLLQVPSSLVSWDLAATNTFSFGVPANILSNSVFENEKQNVLGMVGRPGPPNFEVVRQLLIHMHRAQTCYWNARVPLGSAISC